MAKVQKKKTLVFLCIRITSGCDNTLLHHVRIEALDGIIVCPSPPQQHAQWDQLYQQILHNFYQACLTMHDRFQASCADEQVRLINITQKLSDLERQSIKIIFFSITLMYKYVLWLPFQDSKKENHSKQCRSDEAYLEQGILFNIAASSQTNNKHSHTPSSYWAVGYVFFIQQTCSHRK